MLLSVCVVNGVWVAGHRCHPAPPPDHSQSVSFAYPLNTGEIANTLSLSRRRDHRRINAERNLITTASLTLATVKEETLQPAHILRFVNVAIATYSMRASAT